MLFYIYLYINYYKAQFVSIFIFFITGCIVEKSSKTTWPQPIHKAVQTSIPSLEMVKVAFPSLADESKDDMILDLAKYASIMKLFPLDVPKMVEVPTSSQRAITPTFEKKALNL